MRKDFFYNLLLTGSSFLFPLLTFPYLSRVFGAEGLGICNFIISYGQNYAIVAALGIPVYGIREIAKAQGNNTNRSNIFSELLVIHISITIFLLAIYCLSVFLFDDLRQYRSIALIGGSLIFFNVFSIEWFFSGINKFKYVALRTISIKILSIIAIFLFVRKKDDFEIYFIILSITALLTALVDIRYAMRFLRSKFNITKKGLLSHTRAVTILGIYMVLTSAYSVLPTTLLGFMSTKSSVGYYYGANKIVRMTISLFTALTTVMTPKLNSFFQNNSKEYLTYINKAIETIITIGIPLSYFVFLVSRPLILVLAGNSFENSVPVLKIMAPIVILVAFAQIFVILVLSVNRKDSQMVILSVVGMALSLLINFILIPHFAERATGISQLLSELTVTFISYVFAKKILNFHLSLKTVFINIVLALPIGMITYVAFKIFDNNFLILIFSTIISATYFLIYQVYILKNIFVTNFLTSFSQKR